MNSSPLTENQVWHELFATAPLAVLTRALDAGMVPAHCWDHQGRDLLFTVLNRRLETGFAMPDHAERWNLESDMAPSLERVSGPGYEPRGLKAQLAVFLLKLAAREDARPWERLPSTYSDLQGSAVTAVDLALAWHVPSLVQYCFEHPQAPTGADLVAWNEDLSGQVASPSHRTQLALAVYRNQGLVVHTLLARGLDINALDREGATPLFSASSPTAVEFLMQRGATPALHGGSRSLVEHWGRKIGEPGYPAMIGLVLERGNMSPEQAAVAALAWLEKHSYSVSSYSFTDDADQEKALQRWVDGWEKVRARVGDGLPLGRWTRQVPSGHWKGKHSLLAEVGIEMASISGSYPSLPVVLPLLPPVQEWVSKTPVPMRRGLTDQGIFALGAYGFLASDAYVKEMKTRRKPRAVLSVKEKMLRQMGQAVQDVFALAPASQWEAEFIQASVTLQRHPKEDIQRAVVDAWESRFAYEDSLDKGGMTLAEQITLAERGMDAGVRFFSKDHTSRFVQCATSLENGGLPVEQGPSLARLLLSIVGPAEARLNGEGKKWLEELDRSELTQGWEALAKTLVHSFADSHQRWSWWDTHASDYQTAFALKRWEGTALGREMALSRALPSIEPAAVPKPRF